MKDWGRVSESFFRLLVVYVNGWKIRGGLLKFPLVFKKKVVLF
jgi:hypothetical protein